jgi:hypothetical protein
MVVAYIDGLSLYYAVARDSSFKWLDLVSVADEVMPRDYVGIVHYFAPRDPDPERGARQATYLDALATLDRLVIHEVPADDPVTALGEQLLRDAASGDVECALVMSNDARLAVPIQRAGDEYGLAVGATSMLDWVHPAVREAARFIKHLRKRALQVSLLPSPIHHDGRTIEKPDGW